MNEIIFQNDDLIGEQERALRENPTGHNEVIESGEGGGEKLCVDFATQTSFNQKA